MSRFCNIIIWIALLCVPFSGFCVKESVPAALSNYISEIKIDRIGEVSPQVQYTKIDKDVIKVSITAVLSDSVKLDDWQVNLFPTFKPSFHWAPHLTPTDNHIIAQHVFRAPAIIMANTAKQIAIIPDLDVLKNGSPVDWYMDLNAIESKLTLGMSRSAVQEHVLFVKDSGGVYPPGKVEFGFYVMITDQSEDLFNPWRKALSFFWDKWGSPLYKSGEPLKTKKLLPYINHTYNWAFNSWNESTWQEFELNGNVVGAPTFIVNVTQSPNYEGEVNEREFRSIWNQAWFNSLRSAQGLYRFAKRSNNKELLSYALKTKELALLFPQKDGFFPALIATEMETVTKDGKTFNRSKGWNTYYFGNSNRNPYTWDPKEAPLHVLDMSYTAWLMLTWFDELEDDQRLLDYAVSYADALLEIQDSQGFFPSWLSSDELKVLDVLKQSPETSMSVTFLMKLYQITKEEKYRNAGLKAMDAVMENVVLAGQWEDFETYWSCSPYGADHLVGKKVLRNDMFKQNTFSMYWTSEALLNCYEVTKDKKYLSYGTRTLDEMLMTQATWQPPYIHVRALGGFGVLNADGEWNDSRQSLFSELIVRYGQVLKNKEYTQRGLSALRASFVMMYAPENPETQKQWELAWNFFGKEDYGFMMENYGHGGKTNAHGLGMGEFTIYDWGNGAAAEAYNRMVDHYGTKFLETN